MGYGMGKVLADRAKRLAERYGAPEVAAMVTDAGMAVAVMSDGTIEATQDPPPVGLSDDTAQAPSLDPPKKKGGRPKGSKNKETP